MVSSPNMESPNMEMHVFFTDQAVRSLDGLTAFSALPNAPVLPVKQRRHPLRAVRAAFRHTRPATPVVRQRKPVVIGNPWA